MVFEYLPYNLSQLLNGTDYLVSVGKIKRLCSQILQGLAYIHQHGYFHRDMKPENLLVNNKLDVIKIADFGLAREIDSKEPYAHYVGTRWYRPPELLLGSKKYGPELDMWSMGAIMAEMFTRRPLFLGENHADMLSKICSVIGSPSEDSWADGLHLARDMQYQFPQHPGTPLSLLIPLANEDAINLITSLCSWDPAKRPTAAEALQHPFFHVKVSESELARRIIQRPHAAESKETISTPFMF
ncbi:Pkinase domain-containing protein [Cephalotus follicularis]|uniref:Pkinase domain-containing protein n=1 Tax=Cephalotus follicularis TaxID=3775 RepID=A0A1Q3ANN6_CEPFO|nr:Pkinase domain-containing protein [Cephalotus follicularis]